MPDIRERVEEDRGLIKKIQLKIPGYAGYRRREDIRNADILLRNQVADQVKKVRSDLEGVYLETATETNVAYYTRNGFEVIGEFYPLGVRMWRMFQPRR